MMALSPLQAINLLYSPYKPYSEVEGEEELLCSPDWTESSFSLEHAAETDLARAQSPRVHTAGFADGALNSLNDMLTLGTLLTFAGVLAAGPLLLDAPRTELGRARACNVFSGTMSAAFWSANLVGFGTFTMGFASDDEELMGEGVTLVGFLWLTRVLGAPVFSRILDLFGALAARSSHGALQSWARALQQAARNPQALTAMAMCAHSLDEVAGLKKVFESLLNYLSRLILEQQVRQIAELVQTLGKPKEVPVFMRAYADMQRRRMGGLPAALAIMSGPAAAALPAREGVRQAARLAFQGAQ